MLMIFGLMILGALAELVTIGAVLPFLALVADPSRFANYPVVTRLLSTFSVVGGNSIVAQAAIFFSIAALSAGAIRIILAWASQKFVFRLGRDLGVKAFSISLHQDFSYHVQNNSSKLIALINLVNIVLINVILPIMLSLSAIIISMFIVISLVIINPVVAIGTGIAFGTVYVVIGALIRRRLRLNSVVIAEAQEKRVKIAQESLGGIRDIILNGVQNLYIRYFDAAETKFRDALASTALIGVMPRFIIESFGMVLIAFFAVYLMSGPGGLTVALPVLGALALGSQRLLPLIHQIYNGWTQLAGNREPLLQVVRMLELPLPPRYTSDAAPPLAFERTLELDRVSFRHAVHNPWVLRKLSITIHKGQRIGLVGTTGSGKSTLTDLIMGLLAPTEGAIRIDGIPLGANTIAAWQEQVAHVPQAIYLSDASIAENIAFGTEPGLIVFDRVREAARQAELSPFIDLLPQGMDTTVGERGVRLSGGQRQRIGIARALYKRPKVLVFDEATSALDSATEANVMKAIYALGRELTIFVIAHRMSTLDGCDLIYNVTEGNLIELKEFARPETLLRK